MRPLITGIPERPRRRVATTIPQYAIGLVPHLETVHDRLTMEIRRGCTRGCWFCQPGMLTRPARDVEPDQVVEAVEIRYASDRVQRLFPVVPQLQ